MSELAIRVESLGKRYRLGVIGASTLREDLENWWRTIRAGEFDRKSKGEFWALRGVDLEVRKGEVLGIIGHNGAGKSTLLKLLSRITAPTEGRVCLDGRVASLLEVGTGMHPELTGRENVFLNGAILGMTRAEIARRLDEIVEFSGVERHIDTPVKRYSSGMRVRLGFAVAAHLEPEILIVDEVLAVGDASFQEKCLGKMQDIGESGRTVLFVSHQLGAIRRLCTRALQLSDGGVVDAGDVDRILDAYASKEVSGADAEARRGDDVVLSLAVCQAGGGASSRFAPDQSINIEIDFRLGPDRVGATLGVAVCSRVSFERLFTSRLTLDESAGEHRRVLRIPRDTLRAGAFCLVVGLSDKFGQVLDSHRFVAAFDVVADGSVQGDPGLLHVPCEWRA